MSGRSAIFYSRGLADTVVLCSQDGKRNDTSEDEGDDESDLEHAITWDFGRYVDQELQSTAPICEDIQNLKQLANAHLKKGEAQEAITAYSEAIRAAEKLSNANHDEAVLYSNRAVAYLRKGHPQQVLAHSLYLATQRLFQLQTSNEA